MCILTRKQDYLNSLLWNKKFGKSKGLGNFPLKKAFSWSKQKLGRFCQSTKDMMLYNGTNLNHSKSLIHKYKIKINESRLVKYG